MNKRIKELEAQVAELREALEGVKNVLTICETDVSETWAIIEKAISSTGTDHFKKELEDVEEVLGYLEDVRWTHTGVYNMCNLSTLKTKCEKRKAELKRWLG